MMKTTVGVVGAGSIGFGMCRNLLRAGFDLVVCDVRTKPLEALREQDATIAPTPGTVGRDCQGVFSVVFALSCARLTPFQLAASSL